MGVPRRRRLLLLSADGRMCKFTLEVNEPYSCHCSTDHNVIIIQSISLPDFRVAQASLQILQLLVSAHFNVVGCWEHQGASRWSVQPRAAARLKQLFRWSFGLHSNLLLLRDHFTMYDSCLCSTGDPISPLLLRGTSSTDSHGSQASPVLQSDQLTFLNSIALSHCLQYSLLATLLQFARNDEFVKDGVCLLEVEDKIKFTDLASEDM